MANAHCICPQFLGAHIKNPTVYTDIFVGQFLNSSDQIVIDREEILVTAYLEIVKNDTEAFQYFSVWKKLLDAQPEGKTLISDSGLATTEYQVVFNTISSAVTHHDKVIIAANNNHYAPIFSEINRIGISLINLNSLVARPFQVPAPKTTGYSNFEKDLSWILERIGRTCRKIYSEDDDNDHVRDLLDAKGYRVRDQTREGSSASGIGAGELDLAIENNGRIYTIVEAMKLSALRESYIDDHYRKLITNYNPLSVKRTYLVTYYTGKNFLDWWKKYTSHISGLSPEKFTDKLQSSNDSTVEEETNLHGLKKLYHHITIQGERSICVHYAVRIEN